MNHEFETEEIISVKKPEKNELFTVRLLAVGGVLAVANFLLWFFNYVDSGFDWLYYPLTFALLFKVLRMLHEWYHYVDVSIPEKPKQTKDYKVDMLTTACPGEPHEMIKRTLKAMVAVKYPHTTFLCDEGDDPELKEFCRELGVVHVTRKEKINAKAGNINNALKQATGDICVILDPDHAPHPEFLHRVLPYFEDPDLGYVQVVQAYGNQSESFVATGAAEQTYTFYGPMMMCMNSYGTVQAIGANCTFRRAALDSIGGHAAGLSEDMHTAMQIHAKGWKSVYVPEILSRGYVPSTMPGYMSQQLKWSRGTWDLFFKVYPRLFKNFNWRQKIHYATLPLYFLYGLINLIDFIIPVAALLLCITPWEADFSHFAVMFLPVLVLNLLIRQYAQRWLLEKSERGLHLTGGILRTGTWWVTLTGFLYTLVNKKVPYIPTPKDDEPMNNLKLCIPNLLIILISVFAVIYGLNYDSSPYSGFMAGLALLNVLILSFSTIMAQEKFIKETSEKIRQKIIYHLLIKPAFKTGGLIRDNIYASLRNGTVIVTVITLASFYSFTKIEEDERVDLKTLAPPDMKNTGGFFTGIYLPELDNDQNIKHVLDTEKKFSTRFDIVSFYQAWGPGSIEYFPMKMLKEISKKGSIAMITWEPWPQVFPQFKDHPELGKGKKTCKYIVEGYFDAYLLAYAQKIKEYGEPIFIRPAHEPDNDYYPWSKAAGNTVNEYQEAWRHIVTIFEREGVYNVTWVYNTMKAEAVIEYFPGGDFVDWVGITLLNYGTANSDSTWYSFSELYEPYRKKLQSLKRPVMIAEFGSTRYGGDREKWVLDGLKKIKEDYSEIKSVVFFNSDKDKNWITSWRPENTNGYIDWRVDYHAEEVKKILNQPPFNEHPFVPEKEFSELLTLKTPDKKYNSRFYRGTEGNYEFLVEDQPFYIKGIAYNTAHDWRDGNMPLTRRQVSKDLQTIKNMGANTIRRYAPGPYDLNVIKEAGVQDLKLMYGFWFDPKVDYYRDTLKLLEYIKEVEEATGKYKDYKSIMAWGIGNETWGLLKHTYSKPYLTKVRTQYARFIEHLAQSLHQIDPNRPVYTTSEHELRQLPGEIVSFHHYCPSVDIYSVNSYYEEQLSQLHKLATYLDPGRPYIVSEFGPKGYWHEEFTSYLGHRIKEDSDHQKAALYKKEWKEYVYDLKGYNIGGVAFCWRDRMEGTFTWYGLTDYKGRFRPVYYALKSEWTGKNESHPLGDFIIEAETNDLQPGIRYTFKAQGDPNPNLNYQWNLQREEYLGEINNIKIADEGKTAYVKLPNKNSKYRLYLFVSDDKGNVVCASTPLNIRKKNQFSKPGGR